MIEFVKNEITELVREFYDKPEITLQWKYPQKKHETFDLALLSFPLAKPLSKKPIEIASDIGGLLNEKKPDLIESVEVAGPFINLVFSKTNIKTALLSSFAEKVESTFKEKNSGKTVVVEYSSPNIAKPIGIHHIRSTVIGEVIARMYDAAGYTTKRINYLGDWGIQFGKVLAAYETWENGSTITTVDKLFELYMLYHQKEQEMPELRKRADAWFLRLENGEDQAIALWKNFRDVSIKSFEQIYSRLGIKYDIFTGEGEYYAKGKEFTKECDEKGLSCESEGAKVIFLDDEKMPPLILEKSDGTTIYATRDLAAAKDRFENFNFEKMLYVVGGDQKLHFKQLFKALKMVGYDFADRCKHVDFGMLLLQDGKMSTRKGKIIQLTDVLDRGAELVLEQINEKNPDLKDKEFAAKEISKAAVFFSTLSKKRGGNITFKWEDMLSFNGESGPYLQYSYARACSVLRKLNDSDISEAKSGVSTAPEEDALLFNLYTVFTELDRALIDDEPYIFVEKALSVAQDFNRFYYNCPILKGDDTKERIKTVVLFKKTMEFILPILGITLLEEM